MSLKKPAVWQLVIILGLAGLAFGSAWLVNPATPFDTYPSILTGAALSAFGLAWFLTPQLRDFAVRRGWFDLPDPRRSHTRPTPRIGGLAMLAGFGVAVTAVLAVGMFVPVAHFWREGDLWRIGLLLVGSILIAAIMFVDDIRGLPALFRLGCQFGLAALIVLPQLLVPTGQQPIGVLIERVAGWPLAFLAVPVTLVWIVGMINTVNATDGLDGMAGGVVFIGAAILFVETLFQYRNDGQFQFTSSLLALTLAAAILGFLIFNWHPASIFMGDSGSNFLGYALAVIAIIDGAKVATALLIIGFPALDLAFVYLNRIYHRQLPYKADRNHIHHRLLDMGWTTPRIVLLFYALSLIFGIVGVLPTTQDTPTKIISLVGLVVCLLPLLFYSVRFRPHLPEAGDTEEPSPKVHSNH